MCCRRAAAAVGRETNLLVMAVTSKVPPAGYPGPVVSVDLLKSADGARRREHAVGPYQPCNVPKLIVTDADTVSEPDARLVVVGIGRRERHRGGGGDGGARRSGWNER